MFYEISSTRVNLPIPFFSKVILIKRLVLIITGPEMLPLVANSLVSRILQIAFYKDLTFGVKSYRCKV